MRSSRRRGPPTKPAASSSATTARACGMESSAKVKLGVAPDSWGVWFADDPRQTPWTRYLDEAAQTGVAWTELGPYGYMPTDPDALARELSSRNLALAAGAVMFDLEDSDSWERVRQE